MSVFQEDISKLRRKIEKAKKPAEKISNGDDILNEEINEYKVILWSWKNTFIIIIININLLFVWTPRYLLYPDTFYIMWSIRMTLALERQSLTSCYSCCPR